MLYLLLLFCLRLSVGRTDESSKSVEELWEADAEFLATQGDDVLADLDGTTNGVAVATQSVFEKIAARSRECNLRRLDRGTLRLHVFPVSEPGVDVSDTSFGDWRSEVLDAVNETEFMVRQAIGSSTFTIQLIWNESLVGTVEKYTYAASYAAEAATKASQCLEECPRWDEPLPDHDDGVRPNFCLFVNPQVPGNGVATVGLVVAGQEIRAMVHELSHGVLNAPHDMCYNVHRGTATAYGNPFSVMGFSYHNLPTGLSLLGDRKGVFIDEDNGVQGVSSLIENGYVDDRRVVDAARDGTTVTLGAFDTLASRMDDSLPLAIRISEDVDVPNFFFLVSYRALVDIHTFAPNRQRHSFESAIAETHLPPAGQVEITVHPFYQYERDGVVFSSGYDDASGIFDTTPGSLDAGLGRGGMRGRGNVDCTDSGMLSGGQFFFSDLDLLVEVHEMDPVRTEFDRERLQKRSARVSFLRELPDRPTVVVGVYRISGIADRRARDCGNGVRDPTEQCDGGLGCDASCWCQPGYKVVFGSATTTDCVPTCGDGALQTREQCDTGGTHDDEGGKCGDDCQCAAGSRSMGKYDGSTEAFPRDPTKLHCRTLTTADQEGFSTLTCGNGIVDGLDHCEPALDSTCNVDCSCPARRGIQFNEALLVRANSVGHELPAPFSSQGCVAWHATSGDEDSIRWSSTFRGPADMPFRASAAEEPASQSSLFIAAIVSVVLVAFCCIVGLAVACTITLLRRRSAEARARAAAAAAATPQGRVSKSRSRRLSRRRSAIVAI